MTAILTNLHQHGQDFEQGIAGVLKAMNGWRQRQNAGITAKYAGNRCLGQSWDSEQRYKMRAAPCWVIE